MKKSDYLMEELKFYAEMLKQEYNISLQKGIELLMAVFEEKQLCKDVFSNYSYSVITVENDFFKQGVKAWDWKYQEGK